MSSEETLTDNSENTDNPNKPESAETPAESSGTETGNQEATPADTPQPEQSTTETPAVDPAPVAETPASENPAEPVTSPETPAPAAPEPTPPQTVAPVSQEVPEQIAAAPVTEPEQEQAASTEAPDQSVAPPPEATEPPAQDAPSRPRLNPTGSGSAKAVPSYDQSSDEAAAGAPSSASSQSGSGAQVEIPRGDDLDAELEAVMGGSEADIQAAATAPGVDETAITPPEEFPTEDMLEPGTPLKAKIQSVHGENVFVDLGYRSPGVIPLRQFNSKGENKTPEVGQVVDVSVDKFDPEEGLIQVSLPRSTRKVSGDWDNVTVGQVVECMVEKTIKGGLEVSVGSLRGFMPASQVDIRYISDLEEFVGQKLTAQVTQSNPKRRNLVVSRRNLLEKEREEAAEMIWVKLEEGQIFDGTVKTIKDYGAFIDIGGVDGFLHVGQISWTHINHPKDALEPGQDVQVKVTKLDREKKKISLGMKQLTTNPWANVEEKYAQGTTVSGKVVKVTDFGAFVELEPNVEALVHISQLAYRRVNKVTEVLKVGDTYDFQVTDVDGRKKRISLSYKALQPAPEKPERNRKSDDDDIPQHTEPYQRKRKGPLKGGNSSDKSSGGGLFGNPNDFGN